MEQDSKILFNPSLAEVIKLERETVKEFKIVYPNRDINEEDCIKFILDQENYYFVSGLDKTHTNLIQEIKSRVKRPWLLGIIRPDGSCILRQTAFFFRDKINLPTNNKELEKLFKETEFYNKFKSLMKSMVVYE